MKAYQGNGKYSFVSYSHRDSYFVIPTIKKRMNEGVNIWYDEGIEAGDDWANSIGRKIAEAETVLYFKSKHSENSNNCQRELSYAKKCNIPIEVIKVPIHWKKWAAGILGILVLIVLGFVFLKLVPNVQGRKTIYGKSQVEKAGFDCLVTYDYSEELDFGYTVHQNKKGLAPKGDDVVLTQSLGSEDNLTTVPDTVGQPVGDGIGMLVDAGLLRFTVTAGPMGNQEYGTITFQSAPAGYQVSCNSCIDLMVASREERTVFNYNNRQITALQNIPATLDFSNELERITTEVYPNAVVISVDEPDKTIVVYGQTFDTPIIITGCQGRVYFDSCTINKDVIIVTDDDGIAAIFENNCTIRSENCIIRSHIREANINKFLSKFVSHEPLNVICDNCAGTSIILESRDGDITTFNGTAYDTGDLDTFATEKRNRVKLEPYTGQDRTLLGVSQWWEDGEYVNIVFAQNDV